MASVEVQRKLVAIVAADVAGFSRLMEADEAGTLAALKAHRRIVDPLIFNHGGRIVGTAGDSLLVEFPSVVQALECSVEVQQTMAERNRTLPEDRHMAFRIGINLGDVMVDGDEIYGDGVNIAVRLQSVAEPGAICMSGAVYENVRHKVDVAFQ
ncbi:MAG: adenylate/guanylate cyclase domain-containing protein, partial [Acidimicrobiia bacterium]